MQWFVTVCGGVLTCHYEVTVFRCEFCMYYVDTLYVSGGKGVVQCPLYGGGLQMGCGNVWREWRLSTGYTVTELYCSENSRSQWPCVLRRRSAAARLLRLWVRIPPGHGCLPVLSAVCCGGEASATGWSRVQRSPTECGTSLCVI